MCKRTYAYIHILLILLPESITVLLIQVVK